MKALALEYSYLKLFVRTEQLQSLGKASTNVIRAESMSQMGQISRINKGDM